MKLIGINFFKKLFTNKKKKYACSTCRDLGVVKEASVVMCIREYWNGDRVISFVDPLSSGSFVYNVCPAYCEKARENNERME